MVAAGAHLCGVAGDLHARPGQEVVDPGEGWQWGHHLGPGHFEGVPPGGCAIGHAGVEDRPEALVVPGGVEVADDQQARSWIALRIA